MSTIQGTQSGNKLMLNYLFTSLMAYKTNEISNNSQSYFYGINKLSRMWK